MHALCACVKLHNLERVWGVNTNVRLLVNHNGYNDDNNNKENSNNSYTCEPLNNSILLIYKALYG